ncbi:type VI secretion system baseplate subunit TssF [Photobacterium sp.]|uniref:type VI secretion system baseplate subunit TssF n=1 Tax=Photobacterium sp. TaxID=660 RepID=UPI00299DBA0E|nr:type VI secretion system baseplate subunit TssF [Photobacterium sp.]MDX1302266.1 type VI secretion system baseplate subunit TssF [Photobacterium sp.]
MNFNHYYLSELAALRELGKEFADENPALAPYLSQQGQDPDVERLFEGFAFLTGRLRQRLDDELPELTHSLMRLLWPNYVRPTPAISTLAFTPKAELNQKQLIPRGISVRSETVEDVSCQFKTCFETEIYPLSIASTQYNSTGDGGIYTIRLMLENGAKIEAINLNQLRFHFQGDKATCLNLILALLNHCKHIDYRLLDAESEVITQTGLPATSIKPVGFAGEEGLIDYPLNTFMGYRHIQEFFCYPEKFQYIDLTSLPLWTAELAGECTCVEFSFHFDQLPLSQFYPDRAEATLFCTPIINIFDTDTSPLLLDHRKTLYKLTPVTDHKASGIVIGINSVTGWQPGQQGRITFHDFESFEHDAQNGKGSYYSIKQSPNIVTRQIDTYLSFNLQTTTYRAITVSVSVTACNGQLPQSLPLGSICEMTDSSPEFTTFKNITMPTPLYAPPFEKDGLWSLISNMSLNYVSLTKPEALKKILKAYDFPGNQDDTKAKRTRHLLDGIKNIKADPVDLLLKGLPVRGTHTHLTLDTKHFLCEGELYLFTAVLNEFFSLYASINAFNMLSVHSTEGGDYSWPVRVGQQPVI